jgi:membrane-bound serine protease (ClpP class)
MKAQRYRLAARLLAVGAMLGWLSGVGVPALQVRDTSDAGGRRPLVHVAEVDALITPVSAEYIAQVLDNADDAGADVVVLVLNTPGGLVDSTRDINTSIFESRTPVVVWVGPSGARAASAGVLITIAADVAAMAPGTHFGAAHPVSGTGQPMDDTMAEKAASDVAADARSLASQRGRNIELAEKAVTESQSFTEVEALNAIPPLIDLIVADLDALLAALDGRVVTRWDGRSEVLQTAGAQVEQVEMNWRQRLLSAIAHPQMLVLLFSLGTLGLTIELWNPGAIVPGVVGVLCLLLAFFAAQIIPINSVGLLLVLFGLALLVLEMFTVTFGLLAAGGIVSMVLGLVMLIDSPLPELQLGWPFILSTMLALAAIVTFVTRLAVRAQLRRPVTGVAGMLDESGEVLEAIAPGMVGRVATHGEVWSAISDQPIPQGVRVRVVGIDGMMLTVSAESTAELHTEGTWT